MYMSAKEPFILVLSVFWVYPMYPVPESIHDDEYIIQNCWYLPSYTHLHPTIL